MIGICDGCNETKEVYKKDIIESENKMENLFFCSECEEELERINE